MRTRTYPDVVPGQTIELSHDRATRIVLRALLPQLMLANDLLGGSAAFTVIEAGPRTTVLRHDNGCSGSLSDPADTCDNCEGLLVSFETDIWIAIEVIVSTIRMDSGERYPVRERRLYQSRKSTNGGFTSVLTSEMLNLNAVEAEAAEQNDEAA